MKIVLVSGSARENSNTIKVVRWLEKKLQKRTIETYVIDLHHEALPPNPDQLKNEGGSHFARWRELSAELQSANGYVLMTPEWNGMPTGALLSFFDFVDHEMAYKPAYVGSVSSGVRGGNFPIPFLKGGMNKNAMFVASPEYLVVRDANSVMNGDDPAEGNDADAFTQERALYGLTILVHLIERLDGLSSSDTIDTSRYGSGM